VDDLIEVLVKESKPDFTTGQYKVVLKDKNSDLVLSIWVGYFEGNSIALALEDTWSPRPMTHDLIKNILNDLDTRVGRIIITDLKDNTFYAAIGLVSGDGEILVDSRPSDAIAVAIRCNAPIFVSRKLAVKMSDELDEIFDRLEPEDTVH
jgi:bifunctional DNase/RNase